MKWFPMTIHYKLQAKEPKIEIIDNILGNVKKEMAQCGCANQNGINLTYHLVFIDKLKLGWDG